ncbi:MAG: tetraacyldisaccharide 4'-kinase, partial [Anaerolineae bacterium]
MQALQSIICDIIEGKRGGRGIAFFLYLCSRLYAGAGFLRNLAYDKKWLKDTSVDAVVISIGNIVSGGTGKTPFIHHLAKELEGFCKLAILSRGYRSKMEHAPSPQKLDRQKGGAEEWGDEPCWLAAQLPDVDVWVGKRRSLSAALASSQGAQVILLDDGMQYRHLKRDIEIALIDACDPFGKGYFLPRGYL